MTNAGENVADKRQTRWTGKVVSVGGDKTIRVAVINLVKHERYNKYLRRQTKVAAHDPANAARMGDVVEIVPCRRMSKTKSWRLARIIRSGSILEQAGQTVAEDGTAIETPAPAEPQTSQD